MRGSNTAPPKTSPPTSALPSLAASPMCRSVWRQAVPASVPSAPLAACSLAAPAAAAVEVVEGVAAGGSGRIEAPRARDGAVGWPSEGGRRRPARRRRYIEEVNGRSAAVGSRSLSLNSIEAIAIRLGTSM